MIWRSIQYDWPSVAFLLLLVLPIVWGFFVLYRYRKERLEAFADTSVRDIIVEQRVPAIFWIKVGLYALVWCCGVLALMQPKGNERYVGSGPEGGAPTAKNTISSKAIMRKKMHEVIFLIDVSASMRTEDANGGKSRIAVAKDIVDDVISGLKGESVSLFAFTSATMQIVPSTMDYLFTRLMLRQVAVNEGETAGTDIEQALEALRQRYFSVTTASNKTVVLLSDGGDTHLFGLKGEELKAVMDKIINPILDADDKHVRVDVVGLGSRAGKEVPGVSFEGHSVVSKLEEPLLRKLSVFGRGEFWKGNEMHPLEIAQALSKTIARDTTYVDVSVSAPPPDLGDGTRIYDLYYQVPLGLALLALACCHLLPNTYRRKVEPQGDALQEKRGEA